MRRARLIALALLGCSACGKRMLLPEAGVAALVADPKAPRAADVSRPVPVPRTPSLAAAPVAVSPSSEPGPLPGADGVAPVLEGEAREPAPDPRPEADLAEREMFDGFEAVSRDGKRVDLRALRGKVVLVDFWATWCGPCRADMPALLELYRRRHLEGLEIVGVSLDRDLDKLDRYVSENAIPWPQVADGRGWNAELALRYGVRAIPDGFLIDRDGRLYKRGLRSTELHGAVELVLAEGRQ